MQFGDCRIELAKGNITRQNVDAIVNAANCDLAGGGGVDGAIHQAAGPTLMQQTQAQYPNGCETGSAVATTAGDLSAKFVLHAVGPVWQGGRRNEPDLLASAYRTCLQLAIEHQCQSIAFPAISTGVYGYPVDLAAVTSLTTVRDFLIQHEQPAIVRFVLFSDGHYASYSRTLTTIAD
ncbi:UNVERIFIED_CONTAM: hypothetical protein GTU68_052670 [Idotea baltica]|nr:hypothetical protein [Idotea baltica]